jgi:hypothetical protein
MNIKTSKFTGAVLLAVGLVLLAFPAKAVPLPTPAADVYLVYQGKVTIPFFAPAISNTATSVETQTVYLVTDLASPFSYSLLTVKTDGSYSIDTRVLSADGTGMTAYGNGNSNSNADPTQNFIAGIHNNPIGNATSPTKGYSAFRFSTTGGTATVTINNQTHDYPKTVQVYATGLLAGLSSTVPVTLVAKDTKTKVSGVYTINAIPASITNYIGTVGNAKTKHFPASLSGPLFFYEIDPTLVATNNTTFPNMSALSLAGTFSATLNSTLTSLANVGGSFKLKGQNSATTINPVAAQLNSGSSPTVYEDFLFEIVKSLGLTPGYTPNP